MGSTSILSGLSASGREEKTVECAEGSSECSPADERSAEPEKGDCRGTLACGN